MDVTYTDACICQIDANGSVIHIGRHAYVTTGQFKLNQKYSNVIVKSQWRTLDRQYRGRVRQMPSF